MKKLMMMVAMLAVSFAMQAQTKFHDVELNEAKGAVKCIKSNRMGQDIVINFTQDGKMSQQGMKDAKYDADGYLQSAKMEMMGNEIEVSGFNCASTAFLYPFRLPSPVRRLLPLRYIVARKAAPSCNSRSQEAIWIIH